MVKRWLSLVLVLVVLATAISCAGGGGSGGSPSSVVKGFYTAVNAGDFDKAEEYLVAGQSMEYDNLREFAGKIERVEILDEQIGEVFGVKSATVTVRVTLTPAGQSLGLLAGLEGGTKQFVLEKHKTGWKIVTRM